MATRSRTPRFLRTWIREAASEPTRTTAAGRGPARAGAEAARRAPASAPVYRPLWTCRPAYGHDRHLAHGLQSKVPAPSFVLLANVRPAPAYRDLPHSAFPEPDSIFSPPGG